MTSLLEKDYGWEERLKRQPPTAIPDRDATIVASRTGKTLEAINLEAINEGKRSVP